MIHKKLNCGILLLLGALKVSAGAPVEADRYMGYSGTATARHSTNFLYGEHHFLRYREGRLAERVVLYTCRDGAAFARKTVAYVDPLAPNFTLQDASNGMRQGVRNGGDGRVVFFRSNGAEPEKVGPLPQAPQLVADAGFDEFIRTHWQELMTGKPLDLHFLVPSRLEELNFRARRVRSETLDGIPAEVMQLKPAGLVGWVVPAIEASYSTQDHVLLRYAGLTDLRDASGNNYQADISFPANARSPASEVQITAARQAPLAACK